MINNEFMKGFENEGQVYIYTNADPASGMLIWEGYFELLLSACFTSNFKKGGFLECYYSRNGFYDEPKWRLQNIFVAISELNQYDENNSEIQTANVGAETTKLKNTLLFFLEKAYNNGQKVYVDYN